MAIISKHLDQYHYHKNRGDHWMKNVLCTYVKQFVTFTEPTLKWNLEIGIIGIPCTDVCRMCISQVQKFWKINELRNKQ